MVINSSLLSNVPRGEGREERLVAAHQPGTQLPDACTALSFKAHLKCLLLKVAV